LKKTEPCEDCSRQTRRRKRLTSAIPACVKSKGRSKVECWSAPTVPDRLTPMRDSFSERGGRIPDIESGSGVGGGTRLLGRDSTEWTSLAEEGVVKVENLGLPRGGPKKKRRLSPGGASLPFSAENGRSSCHRAHGGGKFERGRDNLGTQRSRRGRRRAGRAHITLVEGTPR